MNKTRRTTKVSASVKARLKELKVSLDLKNESQVVAYLLAMYDDHFPTMTLLDHKKYRGAALTSAEEEA